MGDWNQLDFARRHLHLFRLPALEVGSMDYGSTQDMRALLGAGGGDYLGIDLSEGPGVDLVLDLSEDFDVVDHLLEQRRFHTVFCLSVLEHCRQPFRMAENISRLVVPGGVAFVSVPHVWEVHAYPDDYWRFTAEGIKTLFPDFEFSDDECEVAHRRPGERLPLNDQPGLVWHTAAFHCSRRRYLTALTTILAKMLLRDRQLFAPTMINMIGRKRPHAP